MVDSMFLDISLLYFLLSLATCIIFLLTIILIWKVAKWKSYNSIPFFGETLLHKFFWKYTFFTYILKFNCFSLPIWLLLYAFWLDFSVEHHQSYPNLFIGFNIGFVIVFVITISSILFMFLKLVFLKKEFMSYKLKISNTTKNIELFKLIITNCSYVNTKNKYYQKIINKVKSAIDNKNDLDGKDLWKFLVKNFSILNYFYNFLYSSRKNLI